MTLPKGFKPAKDKSGRGPVKPNNGGSEDESPNQITGRQAKILAAGFIIVMVTVLGGFSIWYLSEDPSIVEGVKEWSVSSNKVLELCSSIDSNITLGSLEECKWGLKRLELTCIERSYSNTDFCLNTDFQKIDDSLNKRIMAVKEKIVP